MPTAIKIENLSKQYQIGVFGYGYFYKDLQRWCARLRGTMDKNLPLPFCNLALNEDHTIWALKNISMEIKKGERFGILGLNGAGKSTLLKILSRITSPTKGVVKIKGQLSSLLDIGAGFHPELTGYENVYLKGALMGHDKLQIESSLPDIIQFSECDKFIHTPVKRYSSGMYLRLAFSIAVHLPADILVVDEVLAVGDRNFQKKCISRMSQLSAQGCTIVLVSHNLQMIKEFCQKGIVLNNGELIFEGSMEDALGQYQNHR